jgi:hypothetical protein
VFDSSDYGAARGVGAQTMPAIEVVTTSEEDGFRNTARANEGAFSRQNKRLPVPAPEAST